MAKVIIFGTQDFAELANFYLENDSEHEVAAFSVNEKYLNGKQSFCGKPLVKFEDIEKHYPPSEFKFFAPMSPAKMNKLRENIYNAIKDKGYELISYISSYATVLTNNIGDNCFILEDNTIQPFTSIGNNVVLWSGNHIGHHSQIHDHVTFTSHVVLSGHCKVEKYCTFGVNSTIRDGVTLKEGTFVAMGATVVKDSSPWSLLIGSPAKPSEKSSKDI